MQRVLEEHGISTVGYTLLRLVSERVQAPRALWVEALFGRTFGEPGDRERQRALLMEAFEILETAREPGCILRSMVPLADPEHRRRRLQLEGRQDPRKV